MSISNNTPRVFGPVKPSRLALMGIRFLEGEEGAAPVATETPKPADPAQDQTDWKSEARKWETRAKENTSAAQRLAELEEEKKSDEQKVAERIAAAESRAAVLEAKALRAEVAEAKGVPSEGIHGTTKEELEASAEWLLNFKGEQSPPADKKTLYIPDEGGVPAIGKEENITPGMGTLRAAYSQE